MREHTIIRRQQIRNMLYNFIAFAVIFSIFGYILFNLIRTTLYTHTDNELTEIKQILTGERQPEQNDMSGPGIQPALPPNAGNPVLGPRVNLAIQEPDGTIAYARGSEILETYESMLFTGTQNKISLLKLGGKYQYRTIIFLLKENGETFLVQLMINVDGEQQIIENFLRILLISVVVLLLLSLTASYVLSRKTMKPVIRSWNKQTEFVQNASHELRTPLTVLQNKLEMLLTVPNEKIIDKADHISLALSETRRLSKLTADLMTLARSDSADTQLEKDWFEIDPLIKELTQPYLELGSLEGKNFWLDLKYSNAFYGDSLKIHQLLVILLDNALKYTEANDSIIIVTEERDSKLVLEIKDTGMGIKDENIKQVFDRFYREDKARSRENGGAGLGLSIARYIVKIHNGTIKAKHSTPKGTVFTIKLPKS